MTDVLLDKLSVTSSLFSDCKLCNMPHVLNLINLSFIIFQKTNRVKYPILWRMINAILVAIIASNSTFSTSIRVVNQH